MAGDQKAFNACDDLWDCLAAKTFYVGAWGNAVKMKLVTNLVLGLNRAVLAEGLVYAETNGVSREDALQVLLNSPAYSRTMDAKGPKMVKGEFTPEARLSQHIKDVRLILAEAERGNALLPLSTIHLELLEQAEAAGLGELDNSAIIRVIEDRNLRPIADAAIIRRIHRGGLLNSLSLRPDFPPLPCIECRSASVLPRWLSRATGGRRTRQYMIGASAKNCRSWKTMTIFFQRAISFGMIIIATASTASAATPTRHPLSSRVAMAELPSQSTDFQ